jgi:hypothetical protein
MLAVLPVFAVYAATYSVRSARALPPRFSESWYSACHLSNSSLVVSVRTLAFSDPLSLLPSSSSLASSMCRSEYAREGTGAGDASSDSASESLGASSSRTACRAADSRIRMCA